MQMTRRGFLGALTATVAAALAPPLFDQLPGGVADRGSTAPRGALSLADGFFKRIFANIIESADFERRTVTINWGACA